MIASSGTPTVLWRRTGEIELVGKEFCLLTHYQKQDFTNKQKPLYIYEVYGSLL